MGFEHIFKKSFSFRGRHRARLSIINEFDRIKLGAQVPILIKIMQINKSFVSVFKLLDIFGNPELIKE